MEVLLLFIVGFACKSAYDHVKTTRRASRDASVREVAKTYRKGEIPKHKLRAAARRHDAGWWAREFRHGFPVTRTGWSAGWIAHRTATVNHRARLEEIRSGHAEAEASALSELPEHGRRQAEARARCGAILAELKRQPEGQAKGRQAVREAAGEVARKRDERQRQQERHGNMSDPDVAAELAAVPPLPADTIARPQPGPYAGPRFDAPPPVIRTWPPAGEGGDWLKAPMPDPRLSDAQRARDARGQRNICGACGYPGFSRDPLVIAPDGYRVHQSHTEDPASGYHDPFAIDDAVADADHAPFPAGEPCKPGCTYDPRDHRQPMPAPTATKGEQMSDTTLASVRDHTAKAVAQSDQDTAEIRARKEAAYAEADAMTAAGVDPAVVNAQAEYADQLAVAEKALAQAGEHATATAGNAEKYHGGMQEATDNSPGRVASREFHGGS
jgi:hypothetical protein